MSNLPDDQNQRGSSAIFESKERTTASYNGINRRSTHRRKMEDRRGEMRFQTDRRDSSGRRSEDQQPKFW